MNRPIGCDPLAGKNLVTMIRSLGDFVKKSSLSPLLLLQFRDEFAREQAGIRLGIVC